MSRESSSAFREVPQVDATADHERCRSASDPERFLTQLRRELADKLQQDSLETWFRDLEVVAVDDREIVLGVASTFVRDWLTRRHIADLRLAAERVDGVRRLVRLAVRPGGRTDAPPIRNGVTEVMGKVDGALAPGKTETAAGEPAPAAAAPDPVAGAGASRPMSSSINHGYTFEAFVVGPCNRLAHAAAIAIAENPGRAYNPFFLHGSVGLGKTHLLQAMCHAIRRRHPEKRISYLSCEEFTNQFISAIRTGRLDAFRDYFRYVDVLLIDDVQFMADKDRTKEEFFHTFNALYHNHKQVVLSSDSPPAEIPALEDRLVSRFRWGLVTELEKPCYETRVAILLRKAQQRGVELSREVAHLVAKEVDTNIRELEGAVIKLISLNALHEQPIDLDMARQAMRGQDNGSSRQVSLESVLHLIGAEFSLSSRDLTGKSRVHHISSSRQVGMFLAREHTQHSLEEIGRFFGGRDHTTVMYSINKVRKRISEEAGYASLIERLRRRLTAVLR